MNQPERIVFEHDLDAGVLLVKALGGE